MATLTGTSNNDSLIGDLLTANIIDGLDGGDTIVGGNLDDVLNGLLRNLRSALFDGNDLIRGGAGNDLIDGSLGDDTLFGESGDDLIFAGAGNDIVDGGDGNDTIRDRSFAIEPVDLSDNDTINGGDGDDRIETDKGFDMIDGGNGNDFIRSFGLNSTINGGDGDDTLFFSGNAIGGAGNDVLHARFEGNTLLTGGLGKDIFLVAEFGAPKTPNTILDFDQFNDTIRINLAGVTKLSDLTISQTGVDAIISFGGNQVVILKNTLTSALNLTNVAVDPNTPDNPGTTPVPLISQIVNAPGLFQLSQGIGLSTGLNFKKIDHKTGNRNELGIFFVDDSNGTINGILPDKSNYLAELLKRSQVVFSALSDSSIDIALDSLATRTVNLPIDSKLGFYLAVNGTAEDASNVKDFLFSFPSTTGEFQNSKATQTGGAIQISFEDSKGGGDQDFDDLVIQVEAVANPLPLGSGLQGIKEVFDLTNAQAINKATFEIKRDASYNNHVGFYKIEDVSGAIKVGAQLLQPSDSGYRQAVLNSRLIDIDLFGVNEQTVNGKGDFLGGALYAPFVIANSDTPNSDFSNIYTAYSLGNVDNVDHIRLLADNTFGFEDLLDGGDRDFNDVIVKALFQ
jgi:RTX calcium-binding nonapeptide repeat (4 copies)/Domain of unknown function (DUF4114)